jgi:hypothetical protein
MAATSAAMTAEGQRHDPLGADAGGRCVSSGGVLGEENGIG